MKKKYLLYLATLVAFISPCIAQKKIVIGTNKENYLTVGNSVYSGSKEGLDNYFALPLKDYSVRKVEPVFSLHENLLLGKQKVLGKPFKLYAQNAARRWVEVDSFEGINQVDSVHYLTTVIIFYMKCKKDGVGTITYTYQPAQSGSVGEKWIKID